ncbi:hypothetical protein [Salipiger mucosus]|uniref:Uncharacterized protein n=1 Tax=Salipiger mucosus DSM 16094 TaxID=1123237 RepID=S9QAW8_9RHOB|nr:hypothetical protein [Salipiger mucosus]EPX76788.1 hypothetical protein Salmuc_04674 [Salipiger mucosus DSM 16094]
MSGRNARYQFFFRETASRIGERPVSIAAGLVEAPAGSIDPRVVHQFAPNRGENGRLDSLSILEHKVPFQSVDANGTMSDPVLASDPDHLLESPIWPLSQVFDLGALQFRKVDIPPAEDGNEVFATFGMVGARGLALDYTKISVFEGEHNDIEPKQFRGYLGHDVLPERDVPDMDEDMRGEPMKALWRKPLWGFGPEPYVIPTFASREEVSAWTEIANRIGDGAEIDELPDRLHRWIGVQRDEGYVQVTRYLHENYPDYFENAYAPRTAAQDAAHSERMKEAVRETVAAPVGMTP